MLLIVVGTGIFLILFDLLLGRGSPSPAPPRPPGPTTPDSRDFAWTVELLTGPLTATCHVDIRVEAYESAEKRLLEGEAPTKVLKYSDEHCFQIAMQEILDDDAGVGSPEVLQVAARLREIADENMLSNYELAKLTLSFSHEQCIPYSYDKDSKGYDDYFRFPLETIVDATGDCDCKAILSSALYKALGFDVAFALVPGHAALAIASRDALPFSNWSFAGRSWYYCEATGDRWAPGAIPSSVSHGSVQLREVR